MFGWLRRFKPTKIVLISFGLFGCLIGLYLARFGFKVELNLLLTLPLLVIFILKPRIVSIFAVFTIGFIVGGWRGSAYFKQVSQYQNYFGKQVVTIGTVVDDTSYDKNRQTEFHIGNVSLNGQKLPGRLRIRGFGANSVARGDLVKVTGSLNRTIGTSQQGSMSFASIQVVTKNISLVDKVRGKFFASVYSALPEPQASLGLGFLVGVRTALPRDFSDKLALVGLAHIIAVSGYNLTIIVQTVRKLFSKRSAYQSVLFSGILILLFLLMTGWSPSIMRAAVITGFSLLAWYYGRTILPIVLLLLGGAITGFINPLYVWGDVGWYLSFLAFSGVLILSPMLVRLLYREKKPNFLVAILIETLCAIIFTAPYVAWVFGRVSLVAPFANVIVGPLIPLTMFMVFLIGTIGIFFPIFALWLSVFPKAILTFVVWVVEKLSTIPFAQVQVSTTTTQVMLMYLVLFSSTFVLWLVCRRSEARGTIKQIDWNLI